MPDHDASTDRTFPSLHIRPPYGWLNDPNGVSRIDGRYHVFFQHNPDAPLHGNVHWGHVSSTDLVRWEPEPIALAPRPGGVDGGGCWSGCVVDDDGVPTAVYTGVERHAWESGVVLARSDRTLRDWVADDHYQVSIPEDPEIVEVRDPYVFTFEGHRYAVQGAGRREGPPRLLVYGCDDLTRWEPLGDLLSVEDPLAAELAPAQIWECPNLFTLDGRWVLLISIWRFENDTYVLAGVRYLLGDLVGTPEGPRFRTTGGGAVDTGPTFYAPQVLVDGDRRLLWSWAWESPGRQSQVDAAGWAGVLTFPRELRLEGDRLVSAPAAELVELRREPVETDPLPDRFEVVADGPVELSWSEPGADDTVVVSTEEPTRILVDGSIIEVFGDGPSATSRFYPTSTGQWQLRPDDSTVQVWRLGL